MANGQGPNGPPHEPGPGTGTATPPWAASAAVSPVH
jgi:hypothetical protein